MLRTLSESYKSLLMKKQPNKFERGLIYALPIVIFFSYYPVIRLGGNASMNFELSLPLIWLAMFGLLSMLRMPAILTRLGLMKSVVLLLFPIYVILSVFWSLNPLRGVLTAGILWLLFMSGMNLLNLELKKDFLRRLLRIYLTASVIVAIFCIVQCFADVLGVDADITLLCRGCIYETLGFPHPNGLAIEPQFMGNLLIAPALISLVLFYRTIKSAKNKRTVFAFAGLSFFLIMSLYVCFSRGALYAFLIGGAVMGILMLVRDRSARAFYLILPVVLGFSGGLLLQGVWAEMSPTAENFAQGIQRSIHQVTLGKIDLREEVTTEGEQSSFSGYIEESTNVRLDLNEMAVAIWRSNNPLFGVGIGGAGVAIDNYSEELSSKEIVQNEYVNILLELGVVGIILAAVALGIVSINVLKLKNDRLLAPLIIAYLITLCFFSGLPNVLHIYLLTPILFRVGQKQLL